MAALTLRPGGALGGTDALGTIRSMLEQYRAVAVAVAVLRVPCVLRGPVSAVAYLASMTERVLELSRQSILVFLIPWWVIGSRVHSRGLTDVGSVVTMWLPVLGFVALFVWSLRLRRRAHLEVQDIDRMRAEYRDEPDAGT
jgi:hypothetical protein